VTFSIPGRIELSATERGVRPGAGETDFQYPRSDRVVCNYGRLLAYVWLPDFQYPRSDRVVCNCSRY